MPGATAAARSATGERSTAATGPSYYARATDGTLVSQRGASGRANYLYDGQGTVIGLTDQAGELRTDYTYEPYGHPANLTSLGDENPFGYLGTYTAGVEDQGVLCGGPSHIDGAFYDAEDGRFTQLAASLCLPPFGLPFPGDLYGVTHVQDPSYPIPSLQGIPLSPAKGTSIAISDTWHRALVYFGLAEDEEVRRYEAVPNPEPEPEPEQEMEGRYRERPNVRRLQTNYTSEPYGHPANLTSLGNENPFGYLGTYTAGVEDQGVLCGGPNTLDNNYYDPEDGRNTQLVEAPLGLPSPSITPALPAIPSPNDIIDGVDGGLDALNDVAADVERTVRGTYRSGPVGRCAVVGGGLGGLGAVFGRDPRVAGGLAIVGCGSVSLGRRLDLQTKRGASFVAGGDHCLQRHPDYRSWRHSQSPGSAGDHCARTPGSCRRRHDASNRKTGTAG